MRELICGFREQVGVLKSAKPVMTGARGGRSWN